jgi:hypothetical protein
MISPDDGSLSRVFNFNVVLLKISFLINVAAAFSIGEALLIFCNTEMFFKLISCDVALKLIAMKLITNADLNNFMRIIWMN